MKAVLTSIFVLLAFSIHSCKTYSFTGANIPDNIKSLQVNFFPNNSDNGPASLSQTFTEALKDKFITEGNLSLVNQRGDIEFSGYISQYRFTAKAPTQGETTALNRLSIAIKVDFVNHQNEEDQWTQTFTRFADFPSEQTLAEVENDLIQEINVLIVDDIFNKALVKW